MAVRLRDIVSARLANTPRRFQRVGGLAKQAVPHRRELERSSEPQQSQQTLRRRAKASRSYSEVTRSPPLPAPSAPSPRPWCKRGWQTTTRHGGRVLFRGPRSPLLRNVSQHNAIGRLTINPTRLWGDENPRCSEVRSAAPHTSMPGRHEHAWSTRERLVDTRTPRRHENASSTRERLFHTMAPDRHPKASPALTGATSLTSGRAGTGGAARTLIRPRPISLPPVTTTFLTGRLAPHCNKSATALRRRDGVTKRGRQTPKRYRDKGGFFRFETFTRHACGLQGPRDRHPGAYDSEPDQVHERAARRDDNGEPRDTRTRSS